MEGTEEYDNYWFQKDLEEELSENGFQIKEPSDEKEDEEWQPI